MDFCLYENIDETCFDVFNSYWKKYENFLPTLPRLLHSKEEGKATVFNSWLRYTNFNHFLILKREKSLTHSFPDYLSTWVKSRIPEKVKAIVEAKQHDREFMFLFTYNLSRLLLLDMEQFLAQNEHLKNLLRADDYYSSSENNLFSEDPVFKLIKALISNYINVELTTEKCHALFYETHQLTTEQLNEFKSPSLNSEEGNCS